ncbi:MAG: hypothetical protein WDZ63_02825 [Burkholderiales bacterium]
MLVDPSESHILETFWRRDILLAVLVNGTPGNLRRSMFGENSIAAPAPM